MSKARAVQARESRVEKLLPFNGDVEQAFILHPDLDHLQCYDAATLKLAQAEALIRRMQGDDADAEAYAAFDAVLTLVYCARSAYWAAYCRSASQTAS